MRVSSNLGCFMFSVTDRYMGVMHCLVWWLEQCHAGRYVSVKGEINIDDAFGAYWYGRAS